MKIRDSKTGRFAPIWKANRWPDRFKKSRIARKVEYPEREAREEIPLRVERETFRLPAAKFQPVRDSKTGRFAPAWKADRWPDRFNIGPAPLPKLEIASTFRDYASEGTLLKNFDLRKATFARDRLNKNLYIVELPSKKTRKSISFSVNLETGEVKVEKPYPKKSKR